jgi:hypothetical protein
MLIHLELRFGSFLHVVSGLNKEYLSILILHLQAATVFSLEGWQHVQRCTSALALILKRCWGVVAQLTL